MRTAPAFLRMMAAKLRRAKVWICLAPALFVGAAATTYATDTTVPPLTAGTDEEPIEPIPSPAAADPRKLALGERLFEDRRLSHNGSLACISCHDVRTNGAGGPKSSAARDSSKFNTLSVFNAALSFRLNWEGNFKTFEAQAESAFENPVNLNTSVSEVVDKLKAAPDVAAQFREAYGRDPDRKSLLDALATYERSLVTPGGSFDRWLSGDTNAITERELRGYRLFKSLGCISCHQGVNVGGNLFQRSGVFSPLTGPDRPLLRVPSLRNVATRSSYFHDGSVSTLNEAVRRMGVAQLNRTLSGQEIDDVVAFLRTLTGNYRGSQVAGAAP